jgi:hypothetical protein
MPRRLYEGTICNHKAAFQHFRTSLTAGAETAVKVAKQAARLGQKYAGDMPKYTEPGYWVGSVYYQWGRIVLPLFPDDDNKFERVSDRGAGAE